MTDAWNDIENDWETLKKRSPILIVSDKAQDLRSQLDLACAKTLFVLQAEFTQWQGQEVGADLLSKMMARTVSLFMEKWEEGLRAQNLAGLIEFILEGQDLTPTEMKSFLRALPMSLLDKIAQSTLGAKKLDGVYGLVAIEIVMRQRGVQDYRLSKESGKTKVEFEHQGSTIMMFLDELIEVQP